MSVDYTQAEILAMDQAIGERQPPEITPAQHLRAARVTAFALFGNGQGIVVRLRAGETIQNFSLNPPVAGYLMKAIMDVALVAAWKIGGELLHPDASDHGMTNPVPDAERRWEKDLKKGRVIAPDLEALNRSPEVVSINGRGSLDEFAVTFVMENGGLVHFRLNPLVAWKMAIGITEIGMASDWWDGDGNLVPGRALN